MNLMPRLTLIMVTVLLVLLTLAMLGMVLVAKPFYDISPHSPLKYLIHPDIRTLPDALGVAALRYHSTPVDGTAPAADTVLLHSPRPEHTRQQVLAYFIARGCQLAEPSRLLCGNTVQAEVNIQMQNAGEVWVTRYGW